jgi:hypothetical protein
MPCASQTRSKTWRDRSQRVEALGVKATPLSVSTVRNPVGEGLDHLAKKGGAVQLGVGIEEGEVGELRDPVDGQEHEELALGQPQLADVHVDVADGGFGEAFAL